MTKAKTPQPVKLNLAQQEKFKEQILLVLEDYRNTKEPMRFKHDMAQRIMDNLRVVATLKL